jgi:Carboxypeptidase regulatory-like domain
VFHHRSPRVTFALRCCAILVGVAVSTASSCLTPTTPAAAFGTIAGVVSTGGGAISGASVTAVSDSGGEYTATTASNGSYLITNVPDGNGTLSVSVLPSGCTVPNPVSYTVTAADTTSISITVTCAQ